MTGCYLQLGAATVHRELGTGGIGRVRLRPDPTTVPIEGIDPIRVVLVTRAGDTNPLIGDLLNAAFT